MGQAIRRLQRRYRSAALLVALGALSGCLAVLDAPIYRSSDGTTVIDAAGDAALDAPELDAANLDARDGTFVDVTDTVDAHDGSFTDAVPRDVVTVDVPVDRPLIDSGPADAPIDAPHDTTLTCATGRTLCGTVCVDTMTDPHNCSTCGTVCPATDACIAGVCAPACYSDVDCGAGQVCSNTPHCGAVPFCPSPEVLCGGCLCGTRCVGAASCAVGSVCGTSGCCDAMPCATDLNCLISGSHCVAGSCRAPGTCGPTPL